MMYRVLSSFAGTVGSGNNGKRSWAQLKVAKGFESVYLDFSNHVYV